jgi:hypothetical protein
LSASLETLTRIWRVRHCHELRRRPHDQIADLTHFCATEVNSHDNQTFDHDFFLI